MTRDLKLRPEHIVFLRKIINRPAPFIPKAGAKIIRGIFTQDAAPNIDGPENGKGGSSGGKEANPSAVAIEIVRLVNDAGPLTKHIFLDPDGSLVKIPCGQMWRGTMLRQPLPDLYSFARLIEAMPRSTAIALGTKREGLNDFDQLVLLGDPRDGQPGFAARTQQNIAYRQEAPALVLLDYDDGGMPPAVGARLDELGGFLAAVERLCPDLATSGYVHRPSTSANIVNVETGKRYPSAGQHLFALVVDGADAKRFLKALHDRAWQAGLGWFVISEDGKLLPRSIIDVSVSAPERLVFEASADVDPPLSQERREARVHPGPPLDTKVACPDLNTGEQIEVEQLKTAAAWDLAAEANKVREAYDKAHIDAAVGRGVPLERARRMVEHRRNNILTPDVELEFDDSHIGVVKVRDLLADPERFANKTLRAPGEESHWGSNKAVVLRSGLTIFAFTPNGDIYYRLRHDFESIQAAILAAPEDEAPDVFFRLILNGDTNKIEEEKLTQLVSERAGVRAIPIRGMLKGERAKHREEAAQAARLRQRANSTKTHLPAPPADAEAGPIMIEWDGILCRVKRAEPPMRDVSGWPITIKLRETVGLHALTANSANDEETDTSRLPAPKHFLITRHDACSLEIEIGDYITFVKPTRDGERRVCPPERFVTHYLKYMRSALPTVRAVVTMPLVLPNGELLARNGLDRERRMIMRIDPELLKFIRKPEDCTQDAVFEAFRFLVEEWFVDVATDLGGKCVLIAFALSIIERVCFPERPVFFVKAGQRGGGKTTTLTMLVTAATGIKPAAEPRRCSRRECGARICRNQPDRRRACHVQEAIRRGGGGRRGNHDSGWAP